MMLVGVERMAAGDWAGDGSSKKGMVAGGCRGGGRREKSEGFDAL